MRARDTRALWQPSLRTKDEGSLIAVMRSAKAAARNECSRSRDTSNQCIARRRQEQVQGYLGMHKRSNLAYKVAKEGVYI